MKILLVDDDTMFRDNMQALLSLHGFEVCTASDGKQALAAVERFGPDWIVTDLVMPDMDGLETIMAMRRRHPRVSIVAMSGGTWNGALQSLQSALYFGAEAVLIKPFKTVDLLGILGVS